MAAAGEGVREMDDKRTCGECRYCDEDECWTEDDYFWFHFCAIGQASGDEITEITTETPACKCFVPLKKENSK